MEPERLSLNVALATAAERNAVTAAVESMSVQDSDAFFAYLADLLLRVEGARSDPGAALFHVWSYAFALGKMPTDKAFEYLLRIHRLGGGTGRCDLEEGGKALDSHLHRLGFSTIHKLWSNNRDVFMNSEAIALAQITWDVRCPELIEVLDAVQTALSVPGRSSGSRLELIALRRKLQWSLKALYTYDVFICHASADKGRYVDALARSMQDHGFAVWYDYQRLLVGDRLEAGILAGIAESLFVVPVISRESLASIWVAWEIEEAVAKVEHERRGCVLPLVIDDVSLPPVLSPLRALYPLRDGLEACHNELLRKLQRYTLAPTRPNKAMQRTARSRRR
jgi:hypothetical protein